MLTDKEAKTIVDALGLSPEESLAVRLVAKHETQYGAGWGADPLKGGGSNNMGANTTNATGPGTFEHADSRFDPATGKVVKYSTHFPTYHTPSDGFEGLAHVLLFNGSDPKKGRRENVAQALARRSIVELATAMRMNRYFLGTKPLQESITEYAGALEKAYRDVQADTGETLFDSPKAEASSAEGQGSEAGQSSSLSSSRYLSALSRSLPVLRRGVQGDLVGVLQFELGLSPDEIFGPKTEAAVREFQEAHGILVDVNAAGEVLPAGMVGRETWALLFGVESDGK